MKSTPKYKICEHCEEKVELKTDVCTQCGKKEFRPGFIEKRRKITRNFSINIMPHFTNKDSKIINLYKWFPGKSPWKININSSEEWQKIVSIIENELAPLVGWKVENKLLRAIKEPTESMPKTKEEITAITQEYPKFLLKIIKSLDFKQIDEKNHKHVLDILKSIGEVIAKSDEVFLTVFKSILRTLPNQEKLALIQLEDLLKDWSLKQITGITKLVKERINDIQRFELAITKDVTFEIKGNESIHRILERAMWIIDERYWLLHSNETLRKIVGDEIVKRNKKDERKRPDFVCGSVGNKTIIVELKRPSHKLIVDDLNQLEDYLSIIETSSGISSGYEAYLVGKKIDDNLMRKIKYRRSDLFKIRTFSDLIDDTKRRYKQYLEATS